MNLRKYNVNLAKHPSLSTFEQKQASPTTEITIGDLHGNALKLLHFLVLHDIVMISPACYKTIASVYNKDVSKLSKHDIEKFNSSLAKAGVTTKSFLVRLIGDELADRGSNDYFTLKIFEKVFEKNANIKLEILLSNHGAVFIKTFAEGKEKCAIHHQYRSLNNLHQLIKKGLTTKREMLDIVNRYYKPAIKVLSYTLIPNVQQPSTIVIYTHAPVENPIALMHSLAKKLDAESFDETTPLTLSKAIDRINANFSQYLVESKAHKLIKTLVDDEDPFCIITWGRPAILDSALREDNHIITVHGHDERAPTTETNINLDRENILGYEAEMSHQFERNQTGLNNILIYRQTPSLSQEKRFHPIDTQTEGALGTVAKIAGLLGLALGVCGVAEVFQHKTRFLEDEPLSKHDGICHAKKIRARQQTVSEKPSASSLPVSMTKPLSAPKIVSRL